MLACLLRDQRHPTAEEVFRAVNRKNPQISRATVYNCLRALARAGLVRELSVAGGAARFEAHVERHHHFVCEQCGRVEDLDWFDLPRAAVAAAAGLRKFRDYEVVFRGLCGRCSEVSKH